MTDIVKSFKDNLLSQYQIDSFVFIEDLESSPSSTLYQTLKPLIQEAYQSHYRFVFFNFRPVDIKTLTHVYNIITFFDISPYFVLVITNQSATKEYFKNLPEPIRVDYIDQQISNHTGIGSVTPLFNNNFKMCAYAWSGIHVNPSGTTQICCHYNDIIKDSQGKEFSIKTHNINDIVNSEYLVNIRKLFRNGITPVGCRRCEQQEATGGESKRSLAPYKLKNIYGDIDWESEVKFQWIGGHLGNLCNLKCRICNEKFSSSIAAEKLKQIPISEVKSHQVYATLKNNNWNKEDSNFWVSVRSLPNLKNFEWLGGEPLLVNANINFMQYLLDTDQSQDCIFEFVTNGTQYPDILDQAHKFKEFFITISIDNMGKMFELERSGANWHEVDTNLGKFIACQQKNPNVKIGISITVGIQNVLYLPELITYLNHKKVNHYYLNMLTHPSWMSIFNLTPQAKQLALARLTQSNLNNKDMDKLMYIIKNLQNSRISDGSEFRKNMTLLDQIRNENFSDTHREIAQAMGFESSNYCSTPTESYTITQ